MKHDSPHDIYPIGGVRLLLREQRINEFCSEAAKRAADSGD